MIEPDRFIDPSTPDIVEENFERALRPKKLDEYVGQEKIREQLEIFIDAAKKRNEPLDHVLLFGPPGLGKTTLANKVIADANEMSSVESKKSVLIDGDVIREVFNHDIGYSMQDRLTCLLYTSDAADE